MTSPDGRTALPPTNWAGNLRYAARAWHTPESIDELQHVVAAADRAKAVGTRHSFTTIADTDGDLISLAGLPPEIAIDAEANTVTVTGGTRYGDLMPVLEEAGFALHNTGSLPHISIAGATATGTHGSGDGNGILSVAISALEVVRADGELVTIGADDPDMMCLAVGLGAFGVITRVTLDLQPSYLVRQDAYIDAPWDAVLGEFDDIMASAYSVSLLGDFASPVVAQVWQKSRIAPGANDLPDPVPAARFGGALARRRRRRRLSQPQPPRRHGGPLVGAHAALPARRRAVGGRRRAAERIFRSPAGRACRRSMRCAAWEVRSRRTCTSRRSGPLPRTPSG